MTRYLQLDSQRLVETAQRLKKRINERFPTSGLSHVATELYETATTARDRSERIGRPMYGLRISAILLSGAIVGLVLLVLASLEFRTAFREGAEFLQVADAGISSLFFVGAAVFFCLTLETRYKRSRALRAMQELRSLAHVIDMHQLTKDPERIFRGAQHQTASSPQVQMTPFQMGRYLDYCTEMLSLVGKIAVIYVQNFQDAVAIDAVEQIESTTTGLSRKIWQKITLLDTYAARSQADRIVLPPTRPVRPNGETSQE